METILFGLFCGFLGIMIGGFMDDEKQKEKQQPGHDCCKTPTDMNLSTSSIVTRKHDRWQGIVLAVGIGNVVFPVPTVWTTPHHGAVAEKVDAGEDRLASWPRTKQCLHGANPCLPHHPVHI